MKTYVPTIGLEIHAELKTKTKMFCGSANDPHAGEPNTHVCPVCLAHPGTLPVINLEAVKHVLMVGVALNGELATFTEFDRKNYFYPDIPKGYQISQYKYPLVSGGELGGVKITRVHLEEDTARSLHDQGEGSIVDYNRAGVPLMELVTEPVIHDAETAGNFGRELQLLLRTLQVSDANMEKGEMRVEVNISLSADERLGTKVEVKNLNSFRSVEGAIQYEITRQTELLEKGERIVHETRGWDEQKTKTFSQRIKETSEEYRYFPDPDLPKLDLTQLPQLSLSRIRENMPELPNNKREKYSNLGLPREQIEFIVSDQMLSNIFDEVTNTCSDTPDAIRLSANYLTSDVQALISSGSYTLASAHAAEFAALMKLVSDRKVNSRVAKDLLAEVFFEGADPLSLAESRGLLQQNNADAIVPIVKAILVEHDGVVQEYKAGKESALQFLVGQGMKATKGAANPAMLLELIKKEIVEPV